MHDFCYVSKKEAAPVKAELLDIIHEVQDIVRDDFTFQFTFIGSSSRNMICGYTKTSAQTYTISYNANGGSNVPASQTKVHGVTLTLSSTVPYRTNQAERTIR